MTFGTHSILFVFCARGVKFHKVANLWHVSKYYKISFIMFKTDVLAAFVFSALDEHVAKFLRRSSQSRIHSIHAICGKSHPRPTMFPTNWQRSIKIIFTYWKFILHLEWLIWSHIRIDIYPVFGNLVTMSLFAPTNQTHRMKAWLSTACCRMFIDALFIHKQISIYAHRGYNMQAKKIKFQLLIVERLRECANDFYTLHWSGFHNFYHDIGFVV